jgi:alpha-glucosidase
MLLSSWGDRIRVFPGVPDCLEGHLFPQPPHPGRLPRQRRAQGRRTAVGARQKPGGRTLPHPWSVTHAGRPVVTRGALGVEISGMGVVADEGTLAKVETRSIDTTWSPPYGERATIPDRFNEETWTLSHPGHGQLKVLIQARVYDEGAALRYLISGKEDLTVISEKTSFPLPADSQVWVSGTAQGPIRKVAIGAAGKDLERPLTAEIGPGLFAAFGEAGLRGHARMKFRTVPSRRGAMSAPPPRPPGCSMAIIFCSTSTSLPKSPTPRGSARARSCARSPSRPKAAWPASTGPPPTARFHPVRCRLVWPRVRQRLGRHHRDRRSQALARPARPACGDRPRKIQKHRRDPLCQPPRPRNPARQILPLYQKWGVAGIKFGFVNVGSQQWTAWLHDSIAKCAKHQSDGGRARRIPDDRRRAHPAEFHDRRGHPRR